MNGSSRPLLASLILSAALSGCVTGFEPIHIGSGSDCLTADELIEIDVQAAAAEAKSPSPAVATLGRWQALPDSNAYSLHLRVAACDNTVYTHWQTATVWAEVDGDSSVGLGYDVGLGRTYASTREGATRLTAPGGEATFSIATEGGDLELWLDSVSPDLSPSPRIDLLTLEVTCSDDPENLDEDSSDEYFDEYDDC